MTTTLSQKERMLLEDQKHHEQLCIQKYNKYANQAQDAQLKQLFNSLASVEQQHMNTINQILSGQAPNVNQAGQGAQTQAQTGMQAGSAGSFNQNDAELCNDMLTTEKFVSGAYDTTIFECRDTAVRQALNHIQKEEQEHGEKLFNYLQSHGMYNVQG